MGICSQCDPMIGGIALAVFVATAIGTALFRRLAMARGWVARANERSSHTGAIPVGAGIVVFAVSLLAAQPVEAVGRGYIGGVMLLAGVSWADDLYSVPVALRLAVQVVAAVGLLASSGASAMALSLPLIGSFSLGVLTWPLLVLWIVGLINVYNFMDGIDGMAGLQAVIAGGAWYLLGARFAMEGVAHFGLVLAAASAGFLLHNLSKNRIFLGDVGSVFLGYSFAALTVTASLSNPGGPLFFGSALFLWPLLFDTVFTLLRRWRTKKPLTQAHREHLYQRLVQGGVSHVRVSLAYAALSMMGAVAGALLLFQSLVYDVVAVASIASLAFLLWSWVQHVEKRAQTTAVVAV